MIKIKSRAYIKADIKLNAPLMIASGNDDVADITFVRDFNGLPFIPGSSLAGALRDYALSYMGESVPAKKLFGYTEKQGNATNSCQSRLYISDAFPKTIPGMQVRDMVKLDSQTKTAVDGGKFDMESMDAGSIFDLRMELITYESDDVDYLCLVGRILKAMQDSHIMLGAKKNRGFGAITLQDIQIEQIDLIGEENVNTEAVNRWINFAWEHMQANTSIEAICKDPIEEIKHIYWDIPFHIPGSLMIRSYEDFKSIDASMFKTNLGYLIPGTSIAGSIRAACFNILYYDLNIQNPDILLNDLFGFVCEKSKKAAQSKIMISDIPVNCGVEMNYTRNKVDRFTGGVVDSALFTEKLVFDVKGTIKLGFKQNTEAWMFALVQLALADIVEGVVPIGGESAVGRGIIEACQKIPEMQKDWVEALNVKLATLLNAGDKHE